MSKARLIEITRENIEYARAGSLPQADGIGRIPVGHYFDAGRWERECDRVFRRLPLVLATTSELRQAGDYKALSVMDKPVLICRTAEGEIKAYENSCAHRGAQVVATGRGNARRFICPYHAWSYDHQGALRHVLCEDDFGKVDRDSNGLVELPCLEREGLIWVTLDSGSTLSIEHFLCGYDEVLSQFGLDNWHFFDDRVLRGPNWKIAYDGYLDFYHIPILHRDTFGADTPPQAVYYTWGPHQRVSSPATIAGVVGDRSEDDWPMEALLAGVWTIFPHVSIACFAGLDSVEEESYQAVMVSQLFPGKEPGESFTVQNFLVDRELSAEQAEAATGQFEFLKGVVQDEDYATGLKQQDALRTGSREYVLFGRNEEGGQNFHAWVDRILQTDDEHLPELFGPA
jgi:phenylpropionate dioxygenase-like ring-hydroxylating dioxygenase large terminal subunit